MVERAADARGVARPAASSLSERITASTNELAAAFSIGSVLSSETLVSIRMASERGRSVWRAKVKTSCGRPSSEMLMSSCLRVVTNRFCLSAAVKSMLVRSVSTRTTSSS